MGEIDYRIADFSENYLEKLFYFCLRKTGNEHSAEDLTQDISLAVMTELRRNVKPDNFTAWVWKIAHNRYAKWAEAKHKRAEFETGDHIEAYEITDDSTPENEFVRSEDMSLLRRELAFISSEYRNVVVAYYIEDKSVGDIAKSLSLPVGTVKSKLFRARNILKEGMNMAREFGKRSYKLEDISFTSSGSQPSGLPWGAVQRKIPKNILLQADNNPSTVEELSVELGIAVPYMEEEVEMLTSATLLKRLGNKYITNFYIASKECQECICNFQLERSAERSELVDTISDDMINYLYSRQIALPHIPSQDVKWWLVIHIADMWTMQIDKHTKLDPPTRENGEGWGFVGYERTDILKNYVMGHNGSGNGGTMFCAYKISGYDGMWNRIGEMNYDETLLLSDMLANRRKTTELSSSEYRIWGNISGRFSHADSEFNVIPDILVFDRGDMKELNDLIMAHSLYEKLSRLHRECFDGILDILRKETSDILKDSLPYYASQMMYQIRMMNIYDEVNSGKLILPKHPEKSTVAMALELK